MGATSRGGGAVSETPARTRRACAVGNPDAAKADIAKLAELREKLRTAEDAHWAEQVDIQWQVATAWALYAEGKYEDAPNARPAGLLAEVGLRWCGATSPYAELGDSDAKVFKEAFA